MERAHTACTHKLEPRLLAVSVTGQLVSFIHNTTKTPHLLLRYFCSRKQGISSELMNMMECLMSS